MPPRREQLVKHRGRARGDLESDRTDYEKNHETTKQKTAPIITNMTTSGYYVLLAHKKLVLKLCLLGSCMLAASRPLPPFFSINMELSERQETASAFSTFNSAISSLLECELPPCKLVLQSRVFSERCDPKATEKWPLLVTGTPRSGTTYTSAWLTSLGMKLEDDWHHPKLHGTSSWIFAFEDKHNIGPARTGGGKFRHVLHQVRDPLKSITALCTEPLHDKRYLTFLQRHINVTSSYNDWNWKAITTLKFWVDWHQYLNDMKFPTYQIEQVRAEDMFRMAGLESIYNASKADKEKVSKDHNKRSHRSGFSWQDLYSLDPELAAKAWDLAHYFNYSYPDVDFDSLTCLERTPTCREWNINSANPKCPPGTHPFPKDGKKIELRELPVSAGFQGWVNDGCVEHKNEDGTFVGTNGAQKYLAKA